MWCRPARLAGNTGRQKIAKNSPSGHHRTTLSACRSIFATKAFIDNRKSVLNSNIFSTCLHNIVNFGPLTAEICWRVWGTPAYFNGFRVLASLLQRRRSTEVNQTLHDVWPSPALIAYTIHFRGLLPLREFCPVQNSLYVQVLRSHMLTASLHGTPVAGVSQTLRRWEEGATCIRQGGYHVGQPRRTFYLNMTLTRDSGLRSLSKI